MENRDPIANKTERHRSPPTQIWTHMMPKDDNNHIGFTSATRRTALEKLISLVRNQTKKTDTKIFSARNNHFFDILITDKYFAVFVRFFNSSPNTCHGIS